MGRKSTKSYLSLCLGVANPTITWTDHDRSLDMLKANATPGAAIAVEGK